MQPDGQRKELDEVLVADPVGALSTAAGDAEQAQDADLLAEDQPPVRLMALVFLAMFQAYAAMQNLQFKLKKEMGVGQFGERADEFTNAVTMLHVGKLVSRLAHNFVFPCLSPLARSCIAMVAVLFGMAIPPIFVYSLHSTWIPWVFISYGFIGAGIGVFEATFLTVITPLGKRTKSFAILGIPGGFLTIGVPGFLLLGVGMTPEVVYWYVAACIVVALVVALRFAPRQAVGGQRQASVLDSMRHWRLWLPALIPHLVGKAFVNFGMENLFPVIGFTFNADRVPIFGPSNETWLLRKDYFQAVQNFLVFLGDSLSRRVPYYFATQAYSSSVLIILAAMLCEVAGFLLCKLAIAWVAWLAMSLAFWGNGLVYAVGSKHIDRHVPREHNLAAYSCWCFVGDISSVVGAKSQDLVRSWICGGVVSLYECRPK